MKETLIHKIAGVLDDLDFPSENINIQIPKNPDHGDLSCNIAMLLARHIGE